MLQCTTPKNVGFRFPVGWRKTPDEMERTKETLKSTQWANNQSGCKGVCYDNAKGRWMAYLNVNGVRVFSKRFDNYADAVKGRKQAELEYWNTSPAEQGEVK